MSEPDWVVHKTNDAQRHEGSFWAEYVFFCPGCECGHGFKTVGGPPSWSFNYDMVKPTVSPSLLITGHLGRDLAGEDRYGTCHSFIRDGMIQFLDDCTHALRGRTVPLLPF